MVALRGLRGPLLLALLVLAGGPEGCGLASFVRLSINDQIKPEDVAFIEPGRTTMREVVTLLGAPDEMEALGDGVVARYHFRDARYSRINFGYPSGFFLFVPVDMVLSGGGLGADVFQVVFDAEWRAVAHAFAHHAQSSRYRPWPFAD